jgi:hypothetical protein
MAGIFPTLPDFTAGATSVLLGPFQPNATNVVFTAHYSLASAVATTSTITVRTSCVPRGFGAVVPAAATVIPATPITLLSATSTGFSVASIAAGLITLSGATVDSFEATFIVPTAGQYVWLDYVFGGNATIAVALWLNPRSLPQTNRGQ